MDLNFLKDNFQIAIDHEKNFTHKSKHWNNFFNEKNLGFYLKKNIFQIKINLNLRDFIRQIKFISLRIKNNERVDFFSEFVSLKIYHFWYYSWLCPNLPWKAYYFF